MRASEVDSIKLQVTSILIFFTKLRVVVSAPSALLCCRVRPWAAAPAAKLGIRGTRDTALAEAAPPPTAYDASVAAVASILIIHGILTRTQLNVQKQNNHQGHYEKHAWCQHF